MASWTLQLSGLGPVFACIIAGEIGSALLRQSWREQGWFTVRVDLWDANN